jgi:alkaline phosphatase
MKFFYLNFFLIWKESSTYRQEALIPLASETHSGEDVAVYTSGPRAYLNKG